MNCPATICAACGRESANRWFRGRWFCATCARQYRLAARYHAKGERVKDYLDVLRLGEQRAVENYNRGELPRRRLLDGEVLPDRPLSIEAGESGRDAVTEQTSTMSLFRGLRMRTEDDHETARGNQPRSRRERS